VGLAWGVLFGFVFFAELPGSATLAGAALIVLGAFVSRPR
jgi:drug/metabolite transporter (DMT)-like permease